MKPSRSNETELWGLTGGIASGKSTVAGFFAEAGIPVIDADALARELSSEGGLARPLIEKRFGRLSKAELRALVFKDAQARLDLEAILHPLIRNESQKRIDKLSAQGHPHILYEAALLFEAGRAGEMQGVIAVVAGRERQKARLLMRGTAGGAVDEPLAEQILGAQWTDEQRRASASAVIENDCPLEELRARVRAFLAERGWQPLASLPPTGAPPERR